MRFSPSAGESKDGAVQEAIAVTRSPVFRKREDLQRYMSGLNEYRNAVMHSREMTELVEKNGEAALIWFETVLTADQDSGEEAGDE